MTVREFFINNYDTLKLLIKLHLNFNCRDGFYNWNGYIILKNANYSFLSFNIMYTLQKYINYVERIVSMGTWPEKGAKEVTLTSKG